MTDPAPGIVACLEHALEQMGVPQRPDPNLSRFIGPPLQDTFRELLGVTDEDEIDAAIAHYRERFTDVGLFENSVYPGIPQALSELAQGGYELLVATSKPHVFANRIIDHFGLRGFFSRVYGSELSGERTDKGDLIQHVLESESLKADGACMIGDRKHDIVGARRYAVSSIAVLWGYGDEAELEAARPNKIIEAVSDLVTTVGELRGDGRKSVRTGIQE